MTLCKAKISSIFHGSAVDGKGLRSVIFFSGCNLRCGFCHNPETLFKKGEDYSLEDVISVIKRYKNYYKNGGGVTISGGEPFMQADFCISLCKELSLSNINVIAETNGIIVNKPLMQLLSGIRLDVKNHDNEDGDTLIKRYSPFLNECKSLNLSVTLTNVLIPTVNDGEQNATALNKLISVYPECGKIKLLAFHKMCKQKYDELNIPFTFDVYPQATKEDLDAFYEKLNKTTL